ncbi:MAG: PAS domain S-box protein [bacterium]
MKNRELQEEQRKLQESRDRYAELYDCAPVGYVTLDHKGCIHEINLTAAAQLGIERSQLIAKPFVSFLVKSDVSKFRTHLRECRQTNDKVTTELELLVKGSESIHVQLMSIAVQESRHSVLEYRTTILDITERKRIEQELRESEERYRAAFEQAVDPIVLVDTETGAIAKFNRKAYENLGYTYEEFQKLNISDVEVIETAEEVKKHIRKIVKERSDEFETKLKTKSGEILDVLANSKVIRYHGKILLQSIWRDITERKQAEEALRESEEKFRALVESTFEGVVIYEKGKIIEANQSFAKMFGYELSEVMGLSHVEMTTPESAELVARNIQIGFEKPYEIIGVKKDGTTFDLEVVGKDCQYQRRKVRVVAMRDITERKQLENQLKVSLKEKEMLLREVHHRVKNNLQIITSLFDLHSEYIKDKKILETCMRCQHRVKSIALIHEQLYQSKDLAMINFNEYIQSLTQNLFQLYKINSNVIQLKLNVADVLVSINTAIPCGLMINELVSNALKHAFAEDMVGELYIKFRKLDDNKFTLIVRDNGVGFPKDLDFRNTESLGLQLVCILTDQLNGNIELDRRGGATFKITFTEK